METIVYIVRDEEGNYLRKSRNYPQFTSSFTKAGFYCRIGDAKSRQKNCQKWNPGKKYDVVECVVTESKVID